MSLEKRKIHDISPLISSKIAVFPGDTPFMEEFLLDFAKGHNIVLSSIHTTVHLGAHTDAPRHYHPQGVTMEKRSLDRYLGLAQVIEVSIGRGARLRPSHLKQEIQAPRVLFKTNTFPDPNMWNDDFASLSSELIEFLAEKKVLLVGIDTPSIDPADDKLLESHKAVFKNDMGILEGIVLKDMRPGIYELIALPLRIEGADASPVRAVLLEI